LSKVEIILGFSFQWVGEILALLVFRVGFARWQKPNVLKCALGFFAWHTTSGVCGVATIGSYDRISFVAGWL